MLDRPNKPQEPGGYDRYEVETDSVSAAAAGEPLEQEFVHPRRRLIGDEVADARQHFESIRSRDEFCSRFRRDAPDGGILIAP